MKQINSKKLLLPTENSAIQKKLNDSFLVPHKNIKINTKKANILKKSEGKTEDIDKLKSNIIIIKESLVKIEEILKTNSNFIRKQIKDAKKEKENEDRKEKEDKLEKEKSDKEKFPNIKTPRIPGVGIVDYIKNFLKWVIIGRAFVLFGKYLPKLLEFVKYLTPVYNLVKTITGALFNGLVTFVEWTDKAQKKLREVVGSLGGEPFQKVFDDFSGALTTFANLALIAGMATMGGSDLGLGDALDDVSPDTKKTKKGNTKVTTSGGRRAGRPGLRNPLRQRPKVTGTPGLRNPLRQRPKVTGANNLPGNAPRLPSSAGSTARLGAKTLLKTVRPLLRGMVIGGLIDFGLSVALGEDPGRAAFGAVGATLLGTIGGILGGPFAAFTAIGGGMLGDWAGRKLYDAFFSNKKTPSNKPQKKNQGGSIKPKNGKAVQTKRKNLHKNYVKKPIKIPPQKVDPGKDIGGEQKIKRLFPNTDPDSLTVLDWVNARDAAGDPFAGTYQDYVAMRRRELGKKPNPFRALTKTSEILKDIPVIGNIMGGGVDVAMGQKFDTKKLLNQFSSGIGYIVDSIANQKVDMSLSTLATSIRSFAEGGSIPSSNDINKNYNSLSSGELISKILGPNIEQRVNEAILNIQKEVQKKGAKAPKEDGEGSGDGLDMEPGNIKVTSDSPDFWLLVTAALFENGKSTDGYQGAADVAQAIYNRVALPGWPKSIRNVILEKGQFQPVRQYGGYDEWNKIKTKEDAIEFAKKHKGYSGNIVEKVAASLLDTSKQQKARDFVGPRDNFRNFDYEKSVDHLDNSTEVNRYGHVFGFEPGGANIKGFKEGKLKSAEVNKEIVKGTVDKEALEAMVTGGIKPSEIPLTSRQGWRKGKMHKGIDLDGGDKSPISSAQDAKVVHAGWIDDGYGYSVILKYNNGAETRFAHLDSVNVKTGQSIKSGQLIGKQGNTGASRGSHLHFEYYPNGGAMTYEGYGDAYSVKDSYFRYGGNVKAKVVDKSDQKLLTHQDKISKMKFGDAPYEVPGVGRVILKKNDYGTIIKEYYDPSGNLIDSGKFFDKLRGGSSSSAKPGQQPEQKAPSFNASQIAYTNLNDRISKLNSGERIVFDKVGSIQAGKGWLGRPQIKYYNSAGSSISKEDFDKLLAPSEVLKKMRSNDRQLQNLQGGGNIDMNYKNIRRSETLNTYEGEEDYVVYIQPVYFIPDQNQNYIKSNLSASSSSASFIRPSSYIP